MCCYSRVLAGLRVPQVTTDAGPWRHQTTVYRELHFRRDFWHGRYRVSQSWPMLYSFLTPPLSVAQCFVRYLSIESHTCPSSQIPVCRVRYLSVESDTCLSSQIPVHQVRYLSVESDPQFIYPITNQVR